MRVRRALLWLPLPALAAAFGCGLVVAKLAALDQAVAAEPERPASAVVPSPAPPTDPTFDQKIKPFLAQYCNGCHNSTKQAAGLALDVYVSEAHARKDRKTWEAVQHVMAAGEMPPKQKPQPPTADREFVIGWIENTLTKVDCTAPKDPGRVTLRRLNRAEYNNTVRDLCGVDFQPAEDFPSDDVGYGFDNIGDVLSVQPILLEKYLAAADKILTAAVISPVPIASNKETFRPQNLNARPRSARLGPEGQERITLTTEGETYLSKYHFPADGEYAIRVRAWGTAAGGEAPKLAIRLDGKDVHTAPVTADVAKPVTLETKIRLAEGDKRLAAAFVNPFTDAEKKVRTLGVERIEIEGPLGGAVRPSPASTKLILPAVPAGPADKLAVAEKALAAFARKAYRRPVTSAEVHRLVRLFQIADSQGEGYEQAMKLPLKAVLVSPHFLFRVEADPANPDAARQLTDHELAARLSYFLWSTMPDGELSAAADRGDLRKPGSLKAQVERMLKDPKSTALTENFAGQWLQLRSLRTISPDPVTYKGWSEPLRAAMIRETELFFDHVVKNDRPVTEFLDANYTFLNDQLSWHYGVPNVKGPEFRYVKLPNDRRGGVLTQASVLTVTSNPTRTSPVKRGKWILDNVLGTPPPPPAPDVPEFPTGQLKGTVRQQMEQHRENPSCASCHARMDPLGFGFENFDSIGGWRDTDNKQKIDASGVLPDGARFNGPAELRKVLVGKADQFRRCLSEKLMTYALGRGLEYYDKCLLDDMSAKLKADGDRFSALVVAVVESDAFQKRKGKRSD